MKPATRSLIRYRGEECLNCGTPLDAEDKYCHQCGQLNSTKQLALKDFFGEFFSNLFSYDSRIWRTIKHLLFKPGFVSKEFIRGKRLSYANPFRFFLSVCIVFFLMVQAQEFFEFFTDNAVENTKAKNQDADIDVDNGLFSLKIDDINNNESLTREQLKEIENQPYVGKMVAEQIREQQNIQAQTNSIVSEATKDYKENGLTPITQTQLDSLSSTERFFKQIDFYASYEERYKISDSKTALSRMEHDNTQWNQAIYEKIVLIKSITNNPSVLADIILPKLPVFLFLFTPVLTLFLWLLYARRDFTYMEHLVFAFNVFTFVFLSMILLVLVKWISFGYINLAPFFFWFIGPIYFYKSMRNFYDQRRIKTVLKFLLVSFIFVIGLITGISLLLLVGIALY